MALTHNVPLGKCPNDSVSYFVLGEIFSIKKCWKEIFEILGPKSLLKVWNNRLAVSEHGSGKQLIN